MAQDIKVHLKCDFCGDTFSFSTQQPPPPESASWIQVAYNDGKNPPSQYCRKGCAINGLKLAIEQDLGNPNAGTVVTPEGQ